MNFLPKPIEGTILDRPIDPRLSLKWVTDVYRGRPRFKQKRVPTKIAEKPRDVGEERHFELLKAIKSLNIKQEVSQNVTQALEQNRDWR